MARGRSAQNVFRDCVKHVAMQRCHIAQLHDGLKRSGKALLHRYQREGDDFLGRIVAMDETWTCSYEPNLKRQSNEWKHPGSPRPKKVRPTQSAVKEMFIVAYDIDGVILHHAVPPRQTGGQYGTSTKMDALMVYDAFQTFGKRNTRNVSRESTSYKSISSCLYNVWAVHLGVSVTDMPRTTILRTLFIMCVWYAYAMGNLFQMYFTSFLVDPGLEKADLCYGSSLRAVAGYERRFPNRRVPYQEYLPSVEMDERLGIAKERGNERGANRPYFGCDISALSNLMASRCSEFDRCRH
ncbi:hypothetical protein ANN_16822 [Periplaneta americana]|uniref:Uncharacterized protein n=1 Tax=Periplaneta americana TaxID=6978 RepID=A0ABQ8SR71_PERAM|nr:hypothetical protein ANN_16822 [Periplaneta americana]